MDAIKARKAAVTLREKYAALNGMYGIANVRSDLMTIIYALEAGKSTVMLKTEYDERNYLYNYLDNLVKSAGVELVPGIRPGEFYLVEADDEGLELRLEPVIVPEEEEELGMDYGMGM